jgi:gamma-glutamylcyclotransferase (GGCT)/AIG2-like uncharacterized protein YtfP
MADLSLDEVNRLVAAANARGTDAGDAERRLDEHFKVSHNLAVYGTLAPGQPNHHVVVPLGGEWTDGVIEGDLLQVGWGAALGYPAFRPGAGPATVPVKLLTTPRLAAAWPDLDAFEGAEYRRILIPVFTPGPAGERRLYTVAKVYAAAE